MNTPTGLRFPFHIDHVRVSIRKNRKPFYFVTPWEFGELGEPSGEWTGGHLKVRANYK